MPCYLFVYCSIYSSKWILHLEIRLFPTVRTISIRELRHFSADVIRSLSGQPLIDQSWRPTDCPVVCWEWYWSEHRQVYLLAYYATKFNTSLKWRWNLTWGPLVWCLIRASHSRVILHTAQHSLGRLWFEACTDTGCYCRSLWSSDLYSHWFFQYLCSVILHIGVVSRGMAGIPLYLLYSTTWVSLRGKASCVVPVSH